MEISWYDEEKERDEVIHTDDKPSPPEVQEAAKELRRRYDEMQHWVDWAAHWSHVIDDYHGYYIRMFAPMSIDWNIELCDKNSMEVLAVGTAESLTDALLILDDVVALYEHPEYRTPSVHWFVSPPREYGEYLVRLEDGSGTVAAYCQASDYGLDVCDRASGAWILTAFGLDKNPVDLSRITAWRPIPEDYKCVQ